MIEIESADPANHEKAVKLALDMYDLICEADNGGLPFADVAAAIAMLNGTFLASAYRDKPTMAIVARSIARVAVDHAHSIRHGSR